MNKHNRPADFILDLPADAMTMLETAERYAPQWLDGLRRAHEIGNKKEEEQIHERLCTWLTFRLLDMFFAYYEVQPSSDKWKYIPMNSLRSAWIVDLQKGRLVSPTFDRSDVRLAPMSSKVRPIGLEKEGSEDFSFAVSGSEAHEAKRPEKINSKFLCIQTLHLIWNGKMTRKQAAGRICEIVRREYGRRLAEQSIYRYIGEAFNTLKN